MGEATGFLFAPPYWLLADGYWLIATAYSHSIVAGGFDEMS